MNKNKSFKFMTNKLIVFVALMLTLNSFAQGEFNNWYFGNKRGISFNNGAPVALNDGVIQSYEASGVISNAAGELLFYTDGVSVYNRNHQVMPNGTNLSGDDSSTQSGLIVPLPDSNTQFYIFTLDERGGRKGFRYAVVDMSLDGGLGAVTATKNELVYTPSAEKIAAINHANKKDFWIVTHADTGNIFYSHLLTANGLGNPTINSVGEAIGVVADLSGAIKFSPDGKTMAACFQDVVELYDFNNSTGVISNARALSVPGKGGYYGVEFSPNGQVLYVTAVGHHFLYQFDLTANDIAGSKVTIYEELSFPQSVKPSGLQIGPDGKIYCILPLYNYLGCINNPDTLGVGCNFVADQIQISDVPFLNISLGLPAFVQTFEVPELPELDFEDACTGTIVPFKLINGDVVNPRWDFRDGNVSVALEPNHVYQNAGTYEVKVVVVNGLGVDEEITKNIVISESPKGIRPNNLIKCDDTSFGTDTDNRVVFNLTETEAEVLDGQSAALFEFEYYKDEALAQLIDDPNNYVNTNPNETIYVKVFNIQNISCVKSISFQINVTTAPVIVQNLTLTGCDDDNDGFFDFDTTTIEQDLLNGLNDVSVAYWDANNNVLPSPLPNPFTTGSQDIIVRVTNNVTGCFSDATIKFTVSDKPSAFPIPENLTSVCDDEQNPMEQDGVYSFDTSTFQATILGNQMDAEVRYYDENGAALPSPLPNPFVTATQNVLVEVVNAANPECTARMEIPFIVRPLPVINPVGNELVCSDNPAFHKIINAGLLDESTRASFEYTWYKNDVLLPLEESYELRVDEPGIYKVEVKNANGCVSTRTIVVTASAAPIISEVIVSDLSNTNSVVVLVSNTGDYEFSLDNQKFQISNSFSNVKVGEYTVYVRDQNGCGIATKDIAVFGIPNYFTPNGDGQNDTWNIKGVNEALKPTTFVYIFDRYGKLIKQLSPTGLGWDGTYNGKAMPSSDFWYRVHLGDERVVKGHFTLKR